MRIGSVTDEAMCNMAWPGWPTAIVARPHGHGAGCAGRSSYPPDPADRLHLAGEQTKKEAARGGLSFGNGARKGGAVRTAIPLSDTVGAVLIRPAKNLIGAESVQERHTDARGRREASLARIGATAIQRPPPRPKIAP